MAPAAPEGTTHFGIVVAIIFPPPFKGDFQALPSKSCVGGKCCVLQRRLPPPPSFSPNQSEAQRRRLFRSPPFKIASAWCYCRIWWRTVLLQADGQIDATVPPAVCFKKWTVWWVDHCLNSHTETSFNAFFDNNTYNTQNQNQNLFDN